MIAQESRQLQRRRRATFIEDIVLRQAREHVGAALAAGRVHRRAHEREVEHGRKPGVASPARQQSGIIVARRDFPENVEVRDALRGRMVADGGDEGAPELRVHMLGGVDAIAVDAEPVDPPLVDGDEAIHHARIFGRQIVQTDKVAILRAFAAPIGVAAIMIIDGIVQPGWHLRLFLALGNDRRVGEGGIGQLSPVGGACVVIARKAAVDRRAGDAAPAGKGIVGLGAIWGRACGALAILDDVGGMVGDDVHIDFHAARMSGVHQRPKVRVRAEMRVDLREVGHPIAMIACALLAGPALHGLVLEDGREPDGGGAEPLNIVQLRGQPLEVAAMVEAARGGVIAGLEPSAFQAALVVARIAIGEPVGQDEIDDLLHGRSRAQFRQRVRAGRRGAQGHEAGGGRHDNGRGRSSHRETPLLDPREWPAAGRRRPNSTHQKR